MVLKYGRLSTPSLLVPLTYIKCLLKKADNKNSKESSFNDPKMVIVRMKGDIGAIREYFESLIDVFPARVHVIENEYEALNTVVKLMMIAAGLSTADMLGQAFILQ